jgi:hypothetical protein
MDFRVRALGQVAAGNVQVTEDHVRFEVTLGNLEEYVDLRVPRSA